MDLDTHLYLRSYHKPPVNSIIWSLLLAVIIHLIAVLFWLPERRIEVPQLPDWVNIKLVAGMEEIPQAKPISKVVKTRRIKKVVPVTKEKVIEEELQPETEMQQPEQKADPVDEDVAPAAAQTFVKADSKPFAMENPKPVFPLAARRRGMQGSVLLQVHVSEHGKVISVHLMRSSGFRILDVSAMNTVKKWRFMPARQGDEAVASIVEVPIRFVLHGE